jgi:histidinol-phosphatase (PHP family)
MINLHTHTHYSDGSDLPETYVTEAISKGFSALGFSDHSPLPFDNTFALREEKTLEYCNTVIALREKYACKLNIFLGMEVDFIPGTGHSPGFFMNHFPLDYWIGSVHLVKNKVSGELWFIDGPKRETYDEGLKRAFGGDIREGLKAYFGQINEMVTSCKPDVVGHLDKIKMHNHGRYFSENDPYYISLVDETLDLIKNAGCIVEVNTRGLYKKRSESLFPGNMILGKIRDLGIPVIISSDAHKPHELDGFFAETKKTLKEMGFRSQMELTPSGWKEKAIE